MPAHGGWAPVALLALGGAFVVAQRSTRAARIPRVSLAVFPPWWSGEQALAAAGAVGALAGAGGARFVVAVTARASGVRRRNCGARAPGSSPTVGLFPACFSPQNPVSRP